MHHINCIVVAGEVSIAALSHRSHLLQGDTYFSDILFFSCGRFDLILHMLREYIALNFLCENIKKLFIFTFLQVDQRLNFIQSAL